MISPPGWRTELRSNRSAAWAVFSWEPTAHGRRAVSLTSDLQRQVDRSVYAAQI